MDNHKAVLFGATSAVAQAVGRRLIKQGSHTFFYLIGRDPQKLNAVAHDLTVRGATVEIIVSNLEKLHDHDDLVDSVSDSNSFWFFYGSLPVQKEAEKTWQNTEAALNNNFMSYASLLTKVANLLEPRQQESSVVVVSSVAGDRGRQSNYIYGTAKGALSIFCQGLRNRLSKSKVHVLTVKPGFIDTPMTADVKKKPAFLWATPDDIARVIVRAFENKKDVVYAPWFWRYILLIIKLIPEFMFKKMSL